MTRWPAILLTSAALAATAAAAIHRHDNGAMITPLSLEEALAQNVDLSWADLENLTLEGVDFERARLDHASFAGSTLTDCVLERCSLVESRFNGATIDGCDLQRANLREASLVDLSVSGGDWRRADLSNVFAPSLQLRGADFSRTVLSGADLYALIAVDCLLDHVTAPGIQLAGAAVKRCDLTLSRLMDADVSNALLQDLVLDHVQLNGADLSGTRIRQCSAPHGQFQEATLAGVLWGESSPAPFARFDGACYDEWSAFPTGFRPEEEGMEPCGGAVATAPGMACRPNPFNPSTTVAYSLAVGGETSLEVFDLLGRRVARLVEGWQPAGEHRATFDGSTLASGTYLVRLVTPQGVEHRAVQLLK